MKTITKLFFLSAIAMSLNSNGQTWSSLGSGMPHSNAKVLSFYKHSNTKLDISVVQIGSPTRDTIWNWNASSFDTVNGPMPIGSFNVMATVEYAGMYYAATDSGLFEWNHGWANGELNNPSVYVGSVYAVQAYGSNLYMITDSASCVYAKIQKFDGSTHVSADALFKSGCGNWYYCMCQHKGDLYVGGSFSFGGVGGYSVAKISGTTASAPFTNNLGSGAVFGMEYYNNELYVAGTFPGHLAKWDTLSNTWQVIPGFASTSVKRLKTYNTKLYIGSNNCTTLYSFDGTNVASVGTLPIAATVTCMEVYDGKLFIGGSFSNVNNIANTSNIAMFDDGISTGISSVNSNINIKVYPNPSVGVFQIDLTKDSSVTIIDLTGRVVYSERLQGGKNTLHTDFSKGMYFVVLDGKVSAKIIKQ